MPVFSRRGNPAIGVQITLGAYAHPETWEYEDIANSMLAGMATPTWLVKRRTSRRSRVRSRAANGGVYPADGPQSVGRAGAAGPGWRTHGRVGRLAGRARVAPEAAWIAGGLVASTLGCWCTPPSCTR